MKKCILLAGLCLLCLSLTAQENKKTILSEDLIGTTKYDQQTNKSCQNRLYVFDDGTIGATWMFSQTSSFDDRGTGYNYYNGASWGTFPTARIESVKTGWPSYASFGTHGELFVSHKALLSPLVIGKRTSKGTGVWNMNTIPAPYGAAGMLWARVVTNGPDHSNIHVIANTAPVSNGGTYYQGLNGAILYNRSTNGGATWNGWQLLTGMTSSQYLGFSADVYEWANPRGDTLCFVVGDSWHDLFIMKSTDNGTTWTKTLIWNCLYDKWSGGTNVGIYYCPDGSNAVALDKQGIAHVVFGRTRASGDYSGAKFSYPYTDGLIYWNETQQALTQNLDSATLANNHQFIGCVQDPAVWAAGLTALPYFYLSMSSMPVITVDENNHLYVLWSGVTNHRDANNYMLRHIFGRASVCSGSEWCPITELTGGSSYNALECVFPGLSPTSDENITFLYQVDDLGGTYVRGSGGAQGQNVVNTNDIRVQKVLKSTLYCGSAPVVDFSANMLNPSVEQPVEFTDLSVNCPSTWNWSFSPSTVTFAGGTTCGSKAPVVQFNAIGVYSVTLTTSNIFGQGTLTKTDYITVLAPPPPLAGFFADKTSIYTDEVVHFTDLSGGDPTSWEWTFEGGTPSSFIGKVPPAIKYLSAGTFDVTLKVSNQYGSNTEIKTDYIVVEVSPYVFADFTADNTLVNIGSSVQYTDISTGMITQWEWTFSGGNPATSNLQTPPPVSYLTTGKFDVGLKVSNESGDDTVIKSNYITVINPFTPLASFSVDKTEITVGDSVEFTDESSGFPTTYSWAFEGGIPSASALKTPPKIVYPNKGKFDVVLIVTNENGTNSLIRDGYISVGNIGVAEEDPAGFSFYPNPASAEITINTAGKGTLFILDLDGRQLITRNIKKTKMVVNVSELPAGTYIIKVEGENLVKVGKLTKE